MILILFCFKKYSQTQEYFSNNKLQCHKVLLKHNNTYILHICNNSKTATHWYALSLFESGLFMAFV